MLIFKEEISNLSINQLLELRADIEKVLSEKQRGLQPIFRFQFEESSDPRKGFPYVAQLHWNSEKNKIEREFFESSREYHKGIVTVFCEYQAIAGDIIEQRWGGSWKNDYRAWFLVTELGELKQVADIDSSAQKTIVKKYLRGEHKVEEMLIQLS